MRPISDASTGPWFRFRIGSILIATALYSALFALLRWLSLLHVGVVLFAVIVCTIIGFGQYLLYKGNRPRAASIQLGCILGFLLSMALLLSLLAIKWTAPATVGDFLFAEAALVALIFTLIGGVVGYVLGALIRGTFLAIYASSPIWRGKFRQIYDGLVRLPKTVGHAYHSLRDKCASRYARLRPRTRLVLCLLTGTFVLAGWFGATPLKITLYRVAMESAWSKAIRRARRPIIQEAFSSVLSASSGYYEQYERYRDKLVRLGYLEHREFVFENIVVPSQESNIVWQQVTQAFPDNIHLLGSYSSTPEPFRLSVWDRPDRIKDWEAFVRAHDIPNSKGESTPSLRPEGS